MALVAMVTPWRADDGSFMEQEKLALESAGHEVRVVHPFGLPGLPRWPSFLLFWAQAIPAVALMRPDSVFGYVSVYGGVVAALFGGSVHELACPPQRYLGDRIASALARWAHRRASFVRSVSEPTSRWVFAFSGRDSQVIGCVAWPD